MKGLCHHAARSRFPLEIVVPLPISDVKSHAWLHEVDLTWVSRNSDGSTTVLCRTASQADRLRASLNAAIGST